MPSCSSGSWAISPGRSGPARRLWATLPSPRICRLPNRPESHPATAWAKGLALVAGFAAVVAVAVWLGVAWNGSRVPGSFGALELGQPDYGGGVAGHHHEHGAGRSLIALRGPVGQPDVRFRLVAETADVRLPSGRAIRALDRKSV